MFVRTYRGVEYVPFLVSPFGDYNHLFGENCGYSMHKCRGVDHYHQECPRRSYKKKLMEYIQNKELPMNHVSSGGPVYTPGNLSSVIDHKNWVKETCGMLRQDDYKSSPYWTSPHLSPLTLANNRESDYAKGAN